MIGNQFGRLTVVGEAGRSGRAKTYYCKCSCGGTAISRGSALRCGRTRSCGCLQKEAAAKNGASTFRDLSGVRFGRLVAATPSGKTKHGNTLWSCACDCGATALVASGKLISGSTASCGCQRSSESSKRFTTHGMSKRPIYTTWLGMIARCKNKNNGSYSTYGGRGVSVCERWSCSFGNFLADMGDRPSVRHTLERIDNNGDYEPENCRWALASEQSRNKSNNRWIEIGGEVKTMVDWCRQYGRSFTTFYKRIKRGWSDADAVTVPPRAKRATPS